MELNDHLREMLKELGQAINESISGSGRVHDSIQRIREEGYNLYMVLDAKVGVNRRGSSNGNGRRSNEEPLEEVERTGDRATFRINVKDLRFRLTIRGRQLAVSIQSGTATYLLESGDGLTILHRNKSLELKKGKPVTES